MVIEIYNSFALLKILISFYQEKVCSSNPESEDDDDEGSLFYESATRTASQVCHCC